MTDKSLGIVTRNIKKEYVSGDTKLCVLRGVNLQIYPSQLTMLVGPSGCGKTTFISILSGILSATGGDVDINGVTLNRLSDDERVVFRRDNIGFIFQQYNLLPTLSVADNISIPLIARGIRRKQALYKVDEMLDKLNMIQYGYKNINQLSGGQQQRIVIARALVHNPNIVICDEPTAALDGNTGLAVMQILRTHALQQGRIVICVTHDNRIFNFADRIIELKDGNIESDELLKRASE